MNLPPGNKPEKNMNRYNKDVLGNRIKKLEYKISQIKMSTSDPFEWSLLEATLNDMKDLRRRKRLAQKRAWYHRNKKARAAEKQLAAVQAEEQLLKRREDGSNTGQ